MSRLIDADKLEPDTEWNDYDDDFMSYSQSQIRNAEKVQAIPLDRVKKAGEEIQKIIDKNSNETMTDIYLGIGLDLALTILNELITESEEYND